MQGSPYPRTRMAARGGAGLVIALLAIVVLPGWARGDIFVHRDADGVVHLTNAPAASMAQRMLRETPRGIRAVPGIEVPQVEANWAARRVVPRDSRRYDELLRDACDRFGVEFELAKAVMRAESAFDPLAVSSKGARGLMQLMPDTARMHGVPNSFRPADNIEGGVRHLRQLLDRYGDNVVLTVAAYNAGGGRVDAAGGVPNIAETREYVRRVMQFRAEYRREVGGVIARR